jgi:glycosyltransferase involved in cell wall biosynthesis
MSELQQLHPTILENELRSDGLLRPLVSIVIPVFNGDKTIARTILSVQAQIIESLEILVINDGSKDDTVAVVERLAQDDDRIRLYSYANKGTACSRNRGIALATGEFISFIDADDLWQPQKLEAQLQALQANSRAGVAYSWSDFIDEADHLIISGQRNHHQGQVLSALLQRNFLDNGSNSLIRMTVLADLGQVSNSLPSDIAPSSSEPTLGAKQTIEYFNEQMAPAEDWEFHLRLAAKTEFALVPQAHVLYRQGQSTLSSNVVRMEEASLRVIQQSFAQAPLQLQSLKGKTLGNLYQYLAIRSLHGGLSRQGSGLAGRYWMKALAAQPGLLQTKTKLMAILSLKILRGFLLSDRQYQGLLRLFR